MRTRVIVCVSLLNQAISVVIMVLLLIPVDFKAVNVPTNSPNMSEDSLAVHMSVHQLLNYMGIVPSPHINVTDEDLNRVWHLPSNAKISPGMQAIGRCRIVLERKSWVQHAAICNRIPMVWSMVVLSVAFFNVIFCSVKPAIGWKIDPVHVWQQKVKCGKMMGLICSMAWFGSMIIYFLTSRYATQDVGLSFTLYDQICSIPFYHMPIEWSVVLFLCLANYLLKIIETWCFAFATRPLLIGGISLAQRELEKDEEAFWESSKMEFFEKNSGVPPKILQHVAKYIRANNSPILAGFLIQDVTPVSPVFIDAMKTFKGKASWK